MYGYERTSTGAPRQDAGAQAGSPYGGGSGYGEYGYGDGGSGGYGGYPPPDGGQQQSGYAQDPYGGSGYGGSGAGYGGSGYADQGYAGSGYADQGYAGQGGQGYAEQGGGGYADGQRYPEPQGPALADALRGFAAGTTSAEDFQEVFIAAKIYCPRADTPGFLAMPNTSQPLIPMFTSVKELRRFAGKESKYFVVTGGEVLDLLPSGYGFVLDVEGEHRAVFDAKAVEEMVDFTMRRLYG